MGVSIEVIRSKRKSISLEVKPGGRVILRVPQYLPQAQIDAVLSEKKDWIIRALARQDMLEKKRAENPGRVLSEDELKALVKKAKTLIPQRVALYAPVVGVDYGRITIRCQKSRWGSCSAGGNLNFNCLLMLTPIEVIDSVVVHELCHRLEMNHSKRFYAHVLRAFPEYYKYHGWLKEHGSEIMRRV